MLLNKTFQMLIIFEPDALVDKEIDICFILAFQKFKVFLTLSYAIKLVLVWLINVSIIIKKLK